MARKNLKISLELTATDLNETIQRLGTRLLTGTPWKPFIMFKEENSSFQSKKRKILELKYTTYCLTLDYSSFAIQAFTMYTI